MKQVVIALVILALGAAVPVSAQTPNVQVYFDNTFNQAAANCPAAVVIDTAYVVANNFGMWMKGIEYSIAYPAQMTWLADVMVQGGLQIGNSPAGIAISWPLPLNAFSPALVQTVTFIWACTDCAGSPNSALVVNANPGSGALRAIRSPDNVLVSGVGMTSLICATVPTKETSWGQIKALYNN